MRIIVTGASGFVGQQLVPRLVAGGAQVVVIGRDPGALSTLYPDLEACDYDALPGLSGDLLVHLAVRNNDQPGPVEAFEAANVTLMSTVLVAAQEAGIPRILNVSSTQALDARVNDAYAVTKRRAQELLDAAEGIEARTVYLPIVYGDRFAGKLDRLNGMRGVLRRLAFRALSALKPTVHVDLLSAHILDGAQGGILTDGQEANPVYKIVRWAMDWGFALFVVVFLWWALLLIWAAVAVSSPGPGLFVQTRVGRNGRAFPLYKFRTMSKGTKQAGTHEVSAASVTKIGAFLRRTKLDELPQVINILKGELSLIGPRPCLPVQEELVAEREARGVLSILPGISGLAQVEGIDMSDPVTLAKRDADYVALRSILLDLRIALATARGGGGGDRVAK